MLVIGCVGHPWKNDRKNHINIVQIINFVYFAQRPGEKNMVFFSDQKGIAKGETKSYKRWKIALCHTENELCIEVVQRVRWREDATTVWTVGQERRGGGGTFGEVF